MINQKQILIFLQQTQSIYQNQLISNRISGYINGYSAVFVRQNKKSQYPSLYNYPTQNHSQHYPLYLSYSLPIQNNSQSYASLKLKTMNHKKQHPKYYVQPPTKHFHDGNSSECYLEGSIVHFPPNGNTQSQKSIMMQRYFGQINQKEINLLSIAQKIAYSAIHQSQNIGNYGTHIYNFMKQKFMYRGREGCLNVNVYNNHDQTSLPLIRLQFKQLEKASLFLLKQIGLRGLVYSSIAFQKELSQLSSPLQQKNLLHCNIAEDHSSIKLDTHFYHSSYYIPIRQNGIQIGCNLNSKTQIFPASEWMVKSLVSPKRIAQTSYEVQSRF